MDLTGMNFYEAIMLMAFGSSWPFAVYKTITTRRVQGKSLLFLICIFVGYIAGFAFKMTTKPDPVIALYIFNGCLVFTEIILKIKFDEYLSTRFNLSKFIKANRLPKAA